MRAFAVRSLGEAASVQNLPVPDEGWFAQRKITAHNHSSRANPLISPQGLAAVGQMLADGTITARIGSTVDLDSAGQVLEELRHGSLHGKAVIRLLASGPASGDNDAARSASRRAARSAPLFLASTRVSCVTRAARSRSRSAGTVPPQTPCWPTAQLRNANSRHSSRTGQPEHTAMAPAASRLAASAGALTGYQSSAHSPLVEQAPRSTMSSHSAASLMPKPLVIKADRSMPQVSRPDGPSASAERLHLRPPVCVRLQAYRPASAGLRAGRPVSFCSKSRS